MISWYDKIPDCFVLMRKSISLSKESSGTSLLKHLSETPLKSAVTGFSWSKKDQLLLIAQEDCSLKIFDIRENKLFKNIMRKKYEDTNDESDFSGNLSVITKSSLIVDGDERHGHGKSVEFGGNKTKKSFFSETKEINSLEISDVCWNEENSNLIVASFRDKNVGRFSPKKSKIEDGKFYGLKVWDLSMNFHNISDTDSSVSDASFLSTGGNYRTGDGLNISYNALKPKKEKKIPSRYQTNRIEIVLQPKYKIEMNQSVNCVAWMKLQSLVLVAGIGQSLFFIDLRDKRKNKVMRNIHSRNIDSVKYSPYSNKYFFTASKKEVKVWDQNKLDEPVGVLNIDQSFGDEASFSNKAVQIVQVGWSPVEAEKNIIILLTNNNVLQFWRVADIFPKSINSSVNFKFYVHTKAMALSNSFKDGEYVTSFDIHPSSLRRVLCSTTHRVIPFGVKEASSFSFSPSNNLMVGSRNLLREVKNVNSGEDILTVMKKRAEYGIGMKIQENYKIAQLMKDKTALMIWSWAKRIESISTKNTFTGECGFDFGIYSIITIQTSKEVHLPFNTPKNITKSRGKFVKEYLSKKRELCISICAFYDHLEKIDQFLKEYEKNPKESLKSPILSERSVALCLFNQDVESVKKLLIALDVQKNHKFNYNLLNFALTGFCMSGKETKSKFQNAHEHLKDPYLKHSLNFFFNGTTKFVLKSKSIRLSDKIAFACRYLPDSELKDYLKYQLKMLVDTGNVEGIILTGLSNFGAVLMQKYVNRSADVQLPCLLFLRNLRNIKDKLPRGIILRFLEEYRKLLNRWKMFEERALLDSVLACDFGIKHALNKPSVIVTCHNQSCSTKNPKGKKIHYYNALNQSKTLDCICPSCRGILLRCCVCCIPFGKTGHTTKRSEDETGVSERSSFCFCLRCFHGFHVDCNRVWFSKNNVCPVACCNCNCNYK